MGFSENLYHMRSERNMTQEQLAMLMGVSRQAISKWESGRAYPEMDKLVRLCGIFECDLDELVRGDLTGSTVRSELTIPSDSAPADVCGYERHMRARACMLASAAGVPLLSFAVFFGTLPASFVFGATYGAHIISPSFGLAVLVAGILGGLALAAVAVYRHLGFCGRYPCVENFYTGDQHKATAKLTRRACIVSIAACVVGVVACVVKSGPLFHVSGGLCSLFAWGSVAVWSMVYAKLMKARLNVARYNERHAAALEQREAMMACTGLPATRALVAANPDMPRLAQTWVRKRALVVSVAAFAGCVLLGIVFALLGWCIFFIPLIVGSVAAVLLWLYLSCAC